MTTVADSHGEWTYLTSDPEKTCAICGLAIRTAQAAGYVDGEVVHARCYQPPKDPKIPKRDA